MVVVLLADHLVFQNAGAFPATEGTGTGDPYFRAINSKVVGFHEDATENLYSLPPLRNVILVLSQGHVSPTISF